MFGGPLAQNQKTRSECTVAFWDGSIHGLRSETLVEKSKYWALSAEIWDLIRSFDDAGGGGGSITGMVPRRRIFTGSFIFKRLSFLFEIVALDRVCWFDSYRVAPCWHLVVIVWNQSVAESCTNQTRSKKLNGSSFNWAQTLEKKYIALPWSSNRGWNQG